MQVIVCAVAMQRSRLFSILAHTHWSIRPIPTSFEFAYGTIRCSSLYSKTALRLGYTGLALEREYGAHFPRRSIALEDLDPCGVAYHSETVNHGSSDLGTLGWRQVRYVQRNTQQVKTLRLSTWPWNMRSQSVAKYSAGRDGLLRRGLP
jgi:hypothetical protein